MFTVPVAAATPPPLVASLPEIVELLIVDVPALLNTPPPVLETALRRARETEGSFDPTLGPVTALWREARKQHRLPDDDALREALARTGYRHLHLDSAARTATFDIPGMRLDLGGIAKGYAADEALAALGLPSALVALSGDLAIGAPPPGKKGWRIAIGSTGEVRILANTAVSTSGDTEQHLDAAGQRYSHIVDPHTGVGLTARRMVTVIARRGIDVELCAERRVRDGHHQARGHPVSGCVAEQNGQASVGQRNEVVDVASDGVGDAIERRDVPRRRGGHLVRDEAGLQIARELQLVAELHLVDELHGQKEHHHHERGDDLGEGEHARMRRAAQDAGHAEEKGHEGKGEEHAPVRRQALGQAVEDRADRADPAAEALAPGWCAEG